MLTHIRRRSRICCILLVDGVLQVLLQPPDLWVHTHLFVRLQLSTDLKKKEKSV